MEDVLFRGTSVGWPGSETLRSLSLTPATTDPIVATIFAIHSAEFGIGVIYIASGHDLDGVTLEEGNALRELEREVAVVLTPAAFALRASLRVTPDQSLQILREMGIVLPTVLRDPGAVDLALRVSPRLSAEQLEYYVSRSRWIA